MITLMSKKYFLFILMLTSLFVPRIAYGVFFASDKVYVYENGKRIRNNSVIWQTSYKTYFEICTDGICNIGQQFYPVTIYKTTEPNLLPEEQWKTKYYQDHIECEGYISHKAEIEKLWFEYLKTSEYKVLEENAKNEAIAKKIAGVGPYVAQKTYDAEVQYIRSKGYPFYENGICKINNDDYRQTLANLMTTSASSTILNPGPSDGGEGCGYPGCMGGRIGEPRTYSFDIATGKFSQTNKVQAVISDYKIYILGTFGLILIILILSKRIFKRHRVG